MKKTMKRVSERIPGHACMYGAPHDDCPGRTDDHHGIRAEHWWYAVVTNDGTRCLTLDVGTDIYPPELPTDHSARRGMRCSSCGHSDHRSHMCVVSMCSLVSLAAPNGTMRYVDCSCPPDPIEERRRGRDITLHVVSNTPASVEPERQRKLPGSIGYCVDDLDTSALKADEFFRAWGNPNQFEQPARFWQALETELLRWIGRTNRAAADEAERARREYRPQRGDAVEAWLELYAKGLLVAIHRNRRVVSGALASLLLARYRERADAGLPLLEQDHPPGKEP